MNNNRRPLRASTKRKVEKEEEYVPSAQTAAVPTKRKRTAISRIAGEDSGGSMFEEEKQAYDGDLKSSALDGAIRSKRRAAEAASVAVAKMTKAEAQYSAGILIDDSESEHGDEEDSNEEEAEIEEEQTDSARSTEPRVPILDTTLLEKWCPEEGTVSKVGLMHWLRSGSVLPIIKLWHNACTADKGMFAELQGFLPRKKYPWKDQLLQVIKLTKLPDAGRSREAPDIVHLCAIYARKIFLCNHTHLINNGKNSPYHLWRRMLDIPIVALFTTYHDLITTPPSGKTFFSVLLKSPLALPMHADTRKDVEALYPLPEPDTHSGDATTFFTAAPGYKPSEVVRHDAPTDPIDHKVYYEHESFTLNETVLFWITFRDTTKTSQLFRIDCGHIAEILPGRSVGEVDKFFKLHRGSFGLEGEERVVLRRDELVGSGVAVADDGVIDLEEGEEAVTVEDGREGKERWWGGPEEMGQMIGHARALFAQTSDLPFLTPSTIALQAAQGSLNATSLALAEKQADLEDVLASAPVGGMDALEVQWAWFEREEAKSAVEEKEELFREAKGGLEGKGSRGEV